MKFVIYSEITGRIIARLTSRTNTTPKPFSSIIDDCVFLLNFSEA